MNNNILSYKSEILKQYDREAHIYVDRRPWMRTYILYRIINFIQSLLKDNEIILSIGCGPGWLERLLADMHEFVSIDVSHEMVKVAAKCPKIHALVADGEHLPFRPGSFDVIIASRVIKFIDLNSFMKEIKDTLKIGGLVIALFDCGDAFWVKLLEGIGVPVDVGIYNKTLRTQQLLRIMKRHSLNFVKEYPHYSNATIALCPYPSFYDKVCPKA